MQTHEAYNAWSDVYDSMANKTRDMEAAAFRDMLKDLQFSSVLELGCGTGKNTAWLAERCESLTAVDFSVEMMAKAKLLVSNSSVVFIVADITRPWTFATGKSDLVCASLVLEHIEDLSFVFSQAAMVLNEGGHFYIGELHPFKQYTGTKARFQLGDSTLVLDCFMHHTGDFIKAALQQGFVLKAIEERFEEDANSGVPRILSMLFKKTKDVL